MTGSDDGTANRRKTDTVAAIVDAVREAERTGVTAAVEDPLRAERSQTAATLGS